MNWCARLLLLMLAGCTATPDACMERWLAWNAGHGSYSLVCRIDREIDKSIIEKQDEWSAAP